MSECAGSCGIQTQNRIVSNQPSFTDRLKEECRQHLIARQEARKAELAEKGKAGGLNTAEAMELAGYKIEDGLRKMAELSAGSVCYMA